MSQDLCLRLNGVLLDKLYDTPNRVTDLCMKAAKESQRAAYLKYRNWLYLPYGPPWRRPTVNDYIESHLREVRLLMKTGAVFDTF